MAKFLGTRYFRHLVVFKNIILMAKSTQFHFGWMGNFDKNRDLVTIRLANVPIYKVLSTLEATKMFAVT